MLDFTEQDHSITSPPVSSVDTQTVSDNLPVIDTLADPATTAATIAALAPYREFVITQDDTEPGPV